MIQREFPSTSHGLEAWNPMEIIGRYRLKERKIGPCLILWKINENAYKQIQLPALIKTSNIINP